jgi:hypothetical protein
MRIPIAVAILALLAAPQAYADEVVSSGRVRVGLLSGKPDIVSLSLSLPTLRPYELEVGGGLFLFGVSGYVRGGRAWLLYDGREEGRGWTVEGLTLVGWRIEEDDWQRRHGLLATVAVDAVRWFDGWGLNVHLVVGGNLFDFSRHILDVPGRAEPDLRLTVGVAY